MAMQYRSITIAREYGSGGGPIGARLAAELGWDLLDFALIERIARTANVDRNVAASYDERLDSWLHRLNKRTFGRGAFESIGAADIFDCDSMAALARRLIEDAAETGRCVIVGRGAQCILQGRKDVFHVFVYAPMAERIERVRQVYGDSAAREDNIAARDRERASYIRHHFDCNWRDAHLYHAQFCSSIGEETIVSLILHATGLDPAASRQAATAEKATNSSEMHSDCVQHDMRGASHDAG